MKISQTLLPFTLFFLPAGLPAAFASDSPPAAYPREDTIVRLDPVVITAGPLEAPLRQTFDPRAAVQPIPAHDGAEALRSVPGVNVIRKGGTDGDPVLRGMAGSRLGVTLDGETILGGCGMRMDPPTAYVFPAAYDRVTVLKGPQSVRHGPGNSAGLVQFERDPRGFERPGADLRASLTFGSFGRSDQSADLLAGLPLGYVQASANRTRSDDYQDGAGRAVHSEYLRWSTHAALGWTPDQNTLVELSAARSDGEAAYADRGMDGVGFARENLGLKITRRDLSPFVTAVEAQVYDNYIDHVMDNFSLRTPPSNPALRMLNNPDRRTLGARGRITLAAAASTTLALGADAQHNRHTIRNTPAYQSLPRLRDAEFDQLGLFSELTHDFTASRRMVTGARVDFWRAEKNLPGLERDATLPAGFARYEHELGPWTAYAGLGHAERFPDYWEIVGGTPAKPDATFLALAPEKTTQLDLGLTRSRGPLTASLALFANEIQDYILIQPALAGRARNIDARTYGGEAAFAYAFASGWRIESSLASVRGNNETDATALAQLPPLEGRLGLSYSARRWTLGGLWRLVAAQNRVVPGQGNIVGQDIGPSPGFGTLSLNAGMQLAAYARLSLGVDNVLDRTYAEHLSKSGAAVAGFPVTTRVNEPGRTVWLKLDLDY
jgi:iron complex outermembrane receptor protein